MKKFRFIAIFAILATSMATMVSCSDDENKGTPSTFELTGSTSTTGTFYSNDNVIQDAITFTAPEAWKATVTETRSSSVEWLSLSQYEGEAGNVSLSISFSPNTTGALRSANINITCGGTTITITISQTSTNRPSEDPDEEISGVLNPQTDGSVYLNKTAEIALGLFNPDNQKHVIQFANDFVNLYGDYDLPASWENCVYESDDNVVNPGGYGSPMARSMAKLSKALASGNIAKVPEYIYEYVWKLNVNPYELTGIYEPKNGVWEKTGNSDQIVFRFANGSSLGEITVAISSENWTLDMGWSYSYENSYMSEKEEYSIYVNVPEKTTVTIKSGNETIASGSINCALRTGSSIETHINATAADLQATVDITGTNTDLTADMAFRVGGILLGESQATIKGNNFCDPQKMSDVFHNIEYTDYDDSLTASSKRELNECFANSDYTVDILNRVQIKGTAKNLGDMWEYNDEDEAASRAFANTLRANLTANVYYANTEYVQATLDWETFVNDEGWGYSWWEIRPVLVFKFDNSRYAFDDYFGEGRFANIETLYENLFDAYDALWE